MNKKKNLMSKKRKKVKTFINKLKELTEEEKKKRAK